MYKEFSIAMLPTKVKGPFYAEEHIVKCIKDWTDSMGNKTIKVGDLNLCVNSNESVLEYHQPQHLYILQTDTPVNPKPGDKFIFWSNREGFEEICEYVEDRGYGIGGRNIITKQTATYASSQCSNIIIASTDKSLGLPGIPTDFINEYCEKKGFPVAFVEYEEFKSLNGVDIDDNSKMNYTTFYEPKISADNVLHNVLSPDVYERLNNFSEKYANVDKPKTYTEEQTKKLLYKLGASIQPSLNLNLLIQIIDQFWEENK